MQFGNYVSVRGKVVSSCLGLVVWLAGITLGSAQPIAPSGLTATAASTTQINLVWADNSANELGFRIEQSPDTITFNPIATNAASVATYVVTNLSPAVKYYFRVRAFNGSGNSAYTITNNATTRSPWAQWSLGKFTAQQLTNPAVSGMSADPDADGWPNMVEYALNQEPLSADLVNPAVAGLETILGTNFLTLTYTCNVAALEMDCGARVSSDLATWLTGSSNVIGPVPLATNGSLVTEKFLVPAPTTDAGKFLQLNISNPGISNTWEVGTTLPTPLVEINSGWIGDKLYVVGMTNAFFPDTNTFTFVYNITSNTWSRLVPERPFTGNHHAVEVYNGKLYLLGGMDAGADGKVQIYDPATNGWSLGATMPFLAGACSSALINGKMYVAGGIIGEDAGPNWMEGTGTNGAAVYDPVLNHWTMLPPLHIEVNHTAPGTDGTNFYVFGGRSGGNVPDNGYTAVQIYYPSNNTWASSSDVGSTIAPLPFARGGMGKAIYYNGDFYVMGGETETGAGATADHVYNRVDIYNVGSNTWRTGTPMPMGKHGIFPSLRGNRIYVAGGGVVSSVSYSTTMDIYVLPVISP